MKKNNYLYGDGAEVPEIAADVVMRRIELLEENIEELLSVHYETRDTIRISACLKAIDFWRSINDEQR